MGIEARVVDRPDGTWCGNRHRHVDHGPIRMVLLRQPGNPGNDIFLPETVAQKKTGTPETDERIRKNAQRAALYTLLALIGAGVLVLALTTSPGQQIPVEYIAVYCLFSLFTLSAVLAVVKRK